MENSTKEEKSWRERFFESVFGNVNLLNAIVKLLSNPLLISSGIVAFVCWLFLSRETNSQSAEHERMRYEMERIKRKHKKLKKKFKSQQRHFHQTSDHVRSNGHIKSAFLS